MIKRIATGTAALGFALLSALGVNATAQATTPTTPPSASCVNSDPIGLVNVVTCTINTTVQAPVDLPDSVLAFGDVLSNNHVLSGNELVLLQTTIKDVLNRNTVQDKLVFKQALVDALHHLDVDIMDDVIVSKVLVKLL
ncbi:hypothetical protein KCV87_03210 [Actinosynnema pretiosum subsp. pretiosum]|uniref:Secreted protein n=1 Tax=Actinosynnema pretiosum subsp. pretiosum TaxID=103721 RepID=A0AA45L887_9PSEU|nr:hypothetical protein APASM_3376 [Actinosynnema pretiosum subsp. pretiosum]QUF05141.1 hypothetical protein KCV87_03210 [Actinosynnema pretiosum subsp. pretiosum]